MDEVLDTAGAGATAGNSVDKAGLIGSDALKHAVSTTLVEVTPGVAIVFGDVPDGLELISLDMVPGFDRAHLATTLGSLASAGTMVGNVADAASKAQGLYRVNKATLSLLNSGGQMAAKDGAQLGAILKNGKLIAQARFVPVSMTAAATIAAVGPAIAMIALQMQLGEISGLVRTNIQLTTQILEVIRNDQWAELEGLARSVDKAVTEVRELDAVTESVWEPIAGSGPDIGKQLALYNKNVADHLLELGNPDGRARRNYLEINAEAIVFDAFAMLRALRTHAQYQTIRAALARTRGMSDENEARHFELITQRTPLEINSALDEIRSLIGSLVRELRIIAELPGRATLPLSKKRKDAKASQLTSRQLLEAIEPLAAMLGQVAADPAVPMTVCAPEGLDLDPYLRILRWFFEEGEELRSVAFPYEVGERNVAGIVPGVLASRVDASWGALAPGFAGSIVEKVASSTFVAVTDRRIITADPRNLLSRGELSPIYSRGDVRHVRTRVNQRESDRITIDVTMEHQDLHWMFPRAADPEDIDSVATLLTQRSSLAGRAGHDALTQPANGEDS